MHLKFDSVEGVPDSELYMKNGRWDFGKLTAMQDDYFNFLRKYHESGVVFGMPNSINVLMPTIEKISEKYDVNPYVIASIIQSESFGYRYAVGKHGEFGFMGIDPHSHSNAVGKNYSRIFEPEINIEIGASIFKSYLVQFNGNYKKALQAYNAGPHKVRSHRVPECTLAYANKTMINQKKIAAIVRR